MKKFFKYSWMLVLPAVVAAAVIWNASAARLAIEPQCPEGSHRETPLLPVPNDCSSFYSCSDGFKILMHCPDGLHFNAELDTCDWPQDAGCEEEEEKPSNNNGGDGSQYYYEHLSSKGPKACSVSKYVNANGDVKWGDDGAGFGSEWEYESTKSGLIELCEGNRAIGCTAYNDCAQD